MANKNIGLLFGSFNPVHAGHLILANYFVSFTTLHEVWMVLSPQNPFKDKKTLLPFRQRLWMLNLALENHPQIKSCDIENSMPLPSYTYLTLAKLKEKFPENNFSIIMGYDNLLSLHKWKNAEIIYKNHDVYVYPRMNIGKDIPEVKSDRIFLTQAPIVEISSSFIRSSIADKKDIRFFLPEKVFQYIDEMGFYKTKN